MKTASIMGALVLFAVLLFVFRYKRAKMKMEEASRLVRAAQAENRASSRADKDEVAIRELLRYAAEKRYNHFSFKDIVYLVSDDDISGPAKETVLETLKRNPPKR